MAHSAHNWKDNEIISKDLMNSLENDLAALGDKYILPAANPTTPGGVKQAASVSEASGENVTKAEFKALLDALKAAGIMANT